MSTTFSIMSSESSRIAPLAAQIRSQLDELIELVAQQEEDLREARIMLNRANTEVMLYGKQPPADHRANLGTLSDSELFIVAAMELKNPSRIFGNNDAGVFPAREIELVKSTIYNVFETVLGQWSISSCCESDVCFANILINLPDEEQPEETIELTIAKALGNATELVRNNYDIELVVVQSPIVHGYEALPRARVSANYILQQAYGMEMQKNTHVEEVPTPAAVVESAMPGTNTKLEKQFYQFVLSRDLDMAQITMRELINADLNEAQIPFAIAKLRFLNHVESLLNLCGVQRSEVSFIYLRQMESEAALMTLLSDLFQVLRNMQQVNPERIQREKIEEIAAYIRENYSDENLCLAKLCGIYHMNQSYLSRTFKSIYSIGILDYIHTQRILRVKELLKASDTNIDAIWASVGYTNRRTFTRSFRKLEGMSASEYRKDVLNLE